MSLLSLFNCLLFSLNFFSPFLYAIVCHDPNCATCHDASSTGCTSCQSGYLVEAGTCVTSCSAGYYQATSTTCTVCSTSCLTCNGGLSTNCLSCASGYYLDQGACVASCPSGTWISGSTCSSTCSSSCLTCDGPLSTNCLTCASGKYLASDNSCQSCTGNCFTCQSSATNCQSCLTGYILTTLNSIGTCCLSSQYVDSNNNCQNCNTNCLTCSNTATNCLSCSGSLVLKTYNSIGTCCSSNQYADANNICQNCNSNCQTCVTTSTNCLSCYNNLILSSGTCICASTQYYDSGTNSCLNCDSSCLTCSGFATNCLTCNNGFILKTLNSQGSCCLSTQYVNSNYICTDCNSNCQTCITSATNCLSCYGNLILSAGTCTCPTNQYLAASTSCLNCDSNCFTCSLSSTNCLSCYNNLILSSATCICASNQYYDSGTNSCINCDNSCATCSGFSTNCITCNSGFILTVLNSQGYCCLSTQYVNSNNVCTNCNSNCLTCVTSATNCLSCYGNLVLSGGACGCATNQYLVTSTLCANCDNNCKTCASSPTNCLSCFNNLILSSGTCNCASNQYYDSNTNSCLNCDSSCLTCSSFATNCLSCNLGYTLTVMNSQGTCCLSTQYVNSNHVCTNCNSNCQTCVTYASNCLSCYGNLILLSGGSCGCSSNQYLASSSSCVNCDNNCYTCSSSATNCVSCKNNLVLTSVDGQGICKCKINQIMDSSGTVCNDCISPCASCLNTVSNCQSCITNYVLNTVNSFGICCLSNQYIDINNLCTNCDANCKSCSITSTNCLSCYGNLVLTTGKCSCLINQYMDSSGIYCYSCNTICGSCFKSANNCTSCSNSKFVLQYTNGVGFCVCPSGSFLFNGVCESSCPINDYIENPLTNTCDKINKQNVTVYLSDINNPYYFLVVFVSTNIQNVNIQKNLRQELDVISSVSISDNRQFSYNLVPSYINSTSYILVMSYPNTNYNGSSSSMTISFQNSDNPYFETFTDNFSIPLLKALCNESYEYFDNRTAKCIQKTIIDFSWNYGDENNIIILTFSNINSNIVTSIFNETLLCLTIDTFIYTKDYIYSLDNNSNTITITFNYTKQLVGDIYLHLSLNQSLYTTINYMNKTAYLVNRNYDIKLLNYYFLSESEKSAIKTSGTLTKSGSQASSLAMYASMFLSPGTSFAIRGMLLMNIIQLLKYLNIAYPPNVITIFKEDDQRMLFTNNLVDDSEDKIPPTFTLYGVSGSILNNSFDDMFMLWLLVLGAILVAFFTKFENIWKNSSILEGLFLGLKSLFVWNTPIMMFIAKYLRTSVFLCVFAHYDKYPFSPISEFVFSIVCLFYIIIFPFHLFWLVGKVAFFLEKEILPPELLPGINFPSNKVIPITEDRCLPSVDSVKESIPYSPSKTSKTTPQHEMDSPAFQKKKIFEEKEQIVDPFFNIFLSSRRFSTAAEFYDLNKPTKMGRVGIEIFEKENKIQRKRKTVDWGAIKNIKEEDPNEKDMDDYLNDPMTAMTYSKERNIYSKNVVVPMEMTNFEQSAKFGNHNEITGFDLHSAKLKNHNEITGFDIQSAKLKTHNEIMGFEMQSNKINNRHSNEFNGFNTLESKFKAKETNHYDGKKRSIWGIYCQKMVDFIKRKVIKCFEWVYRPKNGAEFGFRYRVVVKGLNRKKRFAKYYFFFDLNRHLLLALVVSQFYEYPMAQILLLELICLIFLIYLIIFKPFETKTDMYLCYINESIVNSAFISAVFLAYFDKNGYLDTDVRMNLGWTIVFMYMILMYGLMINTFQRLVRLIVFLVKKLIEKIKENKGHSRDV